MKQSNHRKEMVDKMKRRALNLFQAGKSTRAVAEILEKEEGFKRSHEWVRTAVLQKMD